MNRDQKAAAIAEIEQKLGSTDTVLAADFRGLTVQQISDLRGALREAEAELSVVKNTLARRAANSTGREALLPYLTGPSGLVWVNGDPAVAAKALSQFASKHQALELKGGMLEGRDLPVESLTRLASLPSREQLIAQLAGGVAAPLRGLAGGLNALIAGLARSLAAVHDQKAAEG
ncbi:MAG: 50S ribosomal protein L10 [Thermoleophilia bacterium]|nr:50S ribosomal protein L10 [Thermoleophilia bacterium]